MMHDRLFRLISCSLALATCLLVGCLTAQARTIVDMAGRSVEVPEKIGKIYSASFPLTVLFYAFAPDLLVATNASVSDKQAAFLPAGVDKLPVIGGASGQGRNVNPEEILALHPDIILAWIGPFPDKGVVERQFARTGLPIVYVRLGKLEDYPAALDFLGALFGRQARTDELKAYIEPVLVKLQRSTAALPADARLRYFYAESADGLSTECADSFHLEAFRVAGGESIDRCQQMTPKGMERISLEEIVADQPAMIVATEPGFRDQISERSEWRNVAAVATGRIAVAPRLPFNWVDRPPTFMRFLGAQWLAHLFHPELFPVDINAETRRFYRLFLGVDLTDADLERILPGADASAPASRVERSIK